MRRVVITGVGAVTPLGRPITRFDASGYAVRIAGEVINFVLDAAVDPREARRASQHVRYALNASLEALRNAQLDPTTMDRERLGVIYGTGAGGIDLIGENVEILRDKGTRRVAPTLIANMIDDAASGYIAIQTGALGPNMAIVAACSTGGHNIGEAFETIRRDDADVIIAGGAESPIVPVIVSSFTNMRGLAGDNENPTAACKPFDARRDGFVLSEGAGAVILEELEHALRRGAPIIAEVIGYGNSNDAKDMIAAGDDGAGPARAMKMAIRKAGIDPLTVDYVNAHGTGTPLNDMAETRAIKTVFGDHAYQMLVNSSKSMLGHMMGAAGAVECIIAALSVHHGVVHPTLNLVEADPNCDLDYVPGVARHADVRIALSNSIGLGGHNSALIVRRYEA
ncbi:MAG: beta-ketoacyl-[acyl-carrier-protein] synthase II [Chloroflexi bacterium]|nr:MAG: beta-ketoacyl-[acyl-carrier-protein] synthase II [Chloroflexota bacterium]